MARNDPQPETTAIDLIALLDNDRTVLGPWAGPAPTRYIERIIDMRMVGTQILVYYRNTTLAVSLNGTTIEAEVAKLAGSEPNTFKLQQFQAFVRDVDSPLDLQLKNQAAYIVLRLGQPTNLLYHPTKPAVTLKDAATAANYGSLRYVARNGDISSTPIEECELIYFIAGNPPYPPLTYRHGFNMNLRLDMGLGPTGMQSVFDFEVDPDVRYPGGSVTETP